MTVTTTVRTAGPYTGVGTVSVYPFAFKVFLTTDVLVQFVTAAGVLSIGTLGTDYSVSLSPDQNNAPGGNIILAVPLASGSTLTVGSQVPQTQTVVLTTPGNFYPQVVSDALDKVTILVQQALGSIIGALRLPEIGAISTLPPAAQRANQLLGFDSTGNPITVAPVSGSAASLAADLTSTTQLSKGAGQIGFAYGLAYAAGTIGNWLQNLATSAGSTFIGYLFGATGSQNRTLQDKLREGGVSVFDFFTPAQIADVVTGTGALDLTTAIQAALDWAAGQTSTTVGSKGARVFFPAGKYRFTNTLYIGYGTIIEGVWAGGYPYISANTQVTVFYADFGSNINRWAIDSQTFYSVAGGSGRIPYNSWVNDHLSGTDATGFNATFGLAIRGILLVDANNALQTNVVYGSIRLNGCPNSRVENVSILGFGLSLTMGCCFGSTVRNITSQTNYYGFVGYNANNGIVVQGNFDKIIQPASLAVPVGVIPSWMASAANMAAVYYLNGSHNASAKGLILAAAPAIGSNCATVDLIAQYWPDTVFLNNSYSTTFTQLYAEQCSGYVLTTAYASFNMLDGHNYSTTAPLPYFADIGYNTLGKVNVGGNNTYLAFWQNAWASLSSADDTSVSVINVSGTGGKLPANQRVTMEDESGTWTPVVTPATGAITSVTGAVGTYKKTRDVVRVEYVFTIANNGTGAGASLTISGLPYAARNQQIQLVLTNSNKIAQAVTNTGLTTIVLFNNDGTYAGATGVTYFGVITYLV